MLFGSGVSQIGAASIIAAVIGCCSSAIAQSSWPYSGSNALNQRANVSPAGPSQLNSTNAPNLKVKWFYPLSSSSGIRATPTVDSSGLYVPADDGYLYKLNKDTGALVWKVNLAILLVGYTGDQSHTAATIVNNDVVVGFKGWVVALDKGKGRVVWKTLVDPSPKAAVKGSFGYANGYLYLGAGGSNEETAPLPYVPTDTGSVVKLDAKTGAIIWQTHTAPLGTGYSGANIWGSAPVADVTSNRVYVTTGNNYSVPNAVGICIKAAGSDMAAQRACLDPTDYVDSILALDMTSGKVVWSRPTIGADAWRYLTWCSLPSVNVCPTVTPPEDADFASGPNLFHLSNFNGVPDDRGGKSAGWVLGAGQKTGVYWALNPANGGLFWSTLTAPPNNTKDQGGGGIQWGSAVDIVHEKYVFVALDSLFDHQTLVGRNGIPVPNWEGGAWGAIDSHTGKIVWQVPTIGKALDNAGHNGTAPGPMTVHNDIVFASSTSGVIVALDFTGAVLWQYSTGAQVQSGPSIVNDVVYWGACYNSPPVPTQTCGIYAFSL